MEKGTSKPEVYNGDIENIGFRLVKKVDNSTYELVGDIDGRLDVIVEAISEIAQALSDVDCSSDSYLMVNGMRIVFTHAKNSVSVYIADTGSFSEEEVCDLDTKLLQLKIYNSPLIPLFETYYAYLESSGTNEVEVTYMGCRFKLFTFRHPEQGIIKSFEVVESKFLILMNLSDSLEAAYSRYFVNAYYYNDIVLGKGTEISPYILYRPYGGQIFSYIKFIYEKTVANDEPIYTILDGTLLVTSILAGKFNVDYIVSSEYAVSSKILNSAIERLNSMLSAVSDPHVKGLLTEIGQIKLTNSELVTLENGKNIANLIEALFITLIYSGIITNISGSNLSIVLLKTAFAAMGFFAAMKSRERTYGPTDNSNHSITEELGMKSNSNFLFSYMILLMLITLIAHFFVISDDSSQKRILFPDNKHEVDTSPIFTDFQISSQTVTWSSNNNGKTPETFEEILMNLEGADFGKQIVYLFPDKGYEDKLGGYFYSATYNSLEPGTSKVKIYSDGGNEISLPATSDTPGIMAVSIATFTKDPLSGEVIPFKPIIKDDFALAAVRLMAFVEGELIEIPHQIFEYPDGTYGVLPRKPVDTSLVIEYKMIDGSVQRPRNSSPLSIQIETPAALEKLNEINDILNIDTSDGVTLEEIIDSIRETFTYSLNRTIPRNASPEEYLDILLKANENGVITAYCDTASTGALILAALEMLGNESTGHEYLNYMLEGISGAFGALNNGDSVLTAGELHAYIVDSSGNILDPTPSSSEDIDDPGTRALLEALSINVEYGGEGIEINELIEQIAREIEESPSLFDDIKKQFEEQNLEIQTEEPLVIVDYRNQLVKTICSGLILIGIAGLIRRKRKDYSFMKRVYEAGANIIKNASVESAKNTIDSIDVEILQNITKTILAMNYAKNTYNGNKEISNKEWTKKTDKDSFRRWIDYCISHGVDDVSQYSKDECFRVLLTKIVDLEFYLKELQKYYINSDIEQDEKIFKTIQVIMSKTKNGKFIKYLTDETES